ncbi:MAG: Fic family protein [Flavobacteriales bacterium]
MNAHGLFDSPFAMEPLFPDDVKGDLEALAVELLAKASRLSGAMHPTTRSALSDLMRPMNSYYSNLIEGHNTHPIDIDKALQKDYSSEKKKTDLQLEALAHINVSKELTMGGIATVNGLDPSSTEFLKGIHKAFYDHLPDSFKEVISEEGEVRYVVPGEWRTVEVKVGRHIAPTHSGLPSFMNRFSSFYDRSASGNRSPIRRIIAMAAAHHRLVWIHPFLDGNGRVVRLFSDAWLRAEGLDGAGLWSISRGLARSRKMYTSMLANADMPRRNSLDGRGNLSNEELEAFCGYFLRTCIDQVEFTHASLQIDTMLERIGSFADRMHNKKRLRAEARPLLQQIFLRGSVNRAEADEIMGVTDKTGKKVTDELVSKGLLVPHKEKEGLPLRFIAAYPIMISPWILPGLYPEGIEAEMMAAS